MGRRKDLGNLTEQIACGLLEKHNFKNITDLNTVRHNHPGGDILANLSQEKYFISVKARNKFQANGKPNRSYNVYPEKVRDAANEYKAIPAWLMIAVEPEKRMYSAYWGLIDELPGGVAVLMTKDATEGYRCLAKDQKDKRIEASMSNRFSENYSIQKKTRSGSSKSAKVGKRIQAVPVPSNVTYEERIAADVLGFRFGTKTHRAASLYLRRQGATTEEVAAANGGAYLNLLKTVSAKGHAVIKRRITRGAGRPVTCYYIEIK